jgi:hypothetical protein
VVVRLISVDMAALHSIQDRVVAANVSD